MLNGRGFDYAFCGGHALDIHLGYATRPHGDIDLSVYWEDRNEIITFMQSQDWIVYEAMGDGKIHLITDDLAREENKQDFDLISTLLPDDNRQWLKNALTTAFPDGHEWIVRLEKAI
jgi:hypothetical protein